MKKKVLFLLPLFLGACSDSGESPVITIEKLYVKVDQGDGETIREDYANRMSEMPALKVGDKVEIIPNHICPVVNLHEYAYLVSKGQVIEKISVECRGKLL
jgi:D-serine deaminase-like pyridoxal phosphate-dependent protein